MCDLQQFARELKRVLIADGSGHENFANNSVITQFHKLNKAAALLRSGDFATMDELSFFAAGGPKSDAIRELKKLMRLVLVLNNADAHHYASSDYRPFIQKLLPPGDIRDDVTVLSFNYDPYLEFRLLRAFETRQTIRRFRRGTPQMMKQAITSGFLDVNSCDWLKESGFCHLKLHGTCVIPASKEQQISLPVQPGEDTTPTGRHIFGFPAAPRLAQFCQPPFVDHDVPAILPWEIIDSTGRILTEAEFKARVGPVWQHSNLYPLFRGIWERARQAVQGADKVSFVGLSLNEYLEPGFKYLFGEKTGELQVVIANPENDKFKDQSFPYHPNSLAARTVDLFQKCGAILKILGSYSEPEKKVTPEHLQIGHQSTITCYSNFYDFIEWEM